MNSGTLYSTLSKLNSWESARSLLITWSYCDGRTVLENAEEHGRDFFAVLKEIKVLEEHKLVEVVE